MMGRGIQLRDKINLIDLKTVHGGYYKDYFIRHIESDWIREKWYRKNNLPIVARIKNENYVIDGNHRWLAAIATRKDAINAIQFNASKDQVLRATLAFPKVIFKQHG